MIPGRTARPRTETSSAASTLASGAHSAAMTPSRMSTSTWLSSSAPGSSTPPPLSRRSNRSPMTRLLTLIGRVALAQLIEERLAHKLLPLLPADHLLKRTGGRTGASQLLEHDLHPAHGSAQGGVRVQDDREPEVGELARGQLRGGAALDDVDQQRSLDAAADLAELGDRPRRLHEDRLGARLAVQARPLDRRL